jgi:hypothetical protein
VNAAAWVFLTAVLFVLLIGVLAQAGPHPPCLKCGSTKGIRATYYFCRHCEPDSQEAAEPPERILLRDVRWLIAQWECNGPLNPAEELRRFLDGPRDTVGQEPDVVEPKQPGRGKA